MTVVVIVACEQGFALAADSWTYMDTPNGKVLENSEQVKSLKLFSKYGVAFAGSEYIVDPIRYRWKRKDFHEYPLDTMYSSRDRSEARRHERKGESSLSELLGRFQAEAPPPEDISECSVEVTRFLRKSYERQGEYGQSARYAIDDYSATVYVAGFTTMGTGKS